MILSSLAILEVPICPAMMSFSNLPIQAGQARLVRLGFP